MSNFSSKMRLIQVAIAIIAVHWLPAVNTASLPDPDSQIVHFLDGINEKIKTFPDTNDNFLQIFCRKGDPKTVLNYFRTAKLRILSSAEDIKIITGHTEAEVYFKFLSSTKWYVWASNLLPWRVREASFPTFNSSCVGVSTAKSYKANLVIRPIDPWNFALLVAGVALFYFAPNLTKSTAFFYTSGTAIGALASALVLIFIVYRTLPKGKISYVSISILWSLCLYFAGESWNRFEELVQEKLPYILVYLTTGAAIALITCYRVGPPTHPKTLDILKWCLQLFGLWLIHLSSEFTELSTITVVSLVLVYYFGRKAKWIVMRAWRRAFPAKMRLLTEEEYLAQGREETRKSLIQLRQFCSSPDCNSWKLASRLKDPERFASFLEGDSHVRDEEVMSYEMDTTFGVEDSSSSEDEGVDHVEPLASPRGPGQSRLPVVAPITAPRSSSRLSTATGRLSRQGTPVSASRSNGTGPSTSNSRRRVPRRNPAGGPNEYLTDDEEPNGEAGIMHTDDEELTD